VTTDPALFNVKLNVPADQEDIQVGVLASALEDLALATTMARAENDHRGAWTVTWILDYEPTAAALLEQMRLHYPDTTLTEADFEIAAVPRVNWLEHSYRQFKPFTIDSFFIYGSHYEDPLPANLTGLQIDAATAFGSGEHGTTAGCLLALLHLKADGVEPATILDMGTGSGILAVAAAKLWERARLWAVDIEEPAIHLTNHHAAINHVSAQIKASHGDGFASADVVVHKPFDMVIANILAGPLISMAPDLAAVLKKDGFVILSGMLDEQTDDVLVAYQTLGFTLRERIDMRGWSALLLKK